MKFAQYKLLLILYIMYFMNIQWTHCAVFPNIAFFPQKRGKCVKCHRPLSWMSEPRYNEQHIVFKNSERPLYLFLCLH